MWRLLWLFVLPGCAGWPESSLVEAAKNAGVSDPTERGLLYIALALIVSAIIRGFLNK